MYMLAVSPWMGGSIISFRTMYLLVLALLIVTAINLSAYLCQPGFFSANGVSVIICIFSPFAMASPAGGEVVAAALITASNQWEYSPSFLFR